MCLINHSGEFSLRSNRLWLNRVAGGMVLLGPEVTTDADRRAE